MRHIRAKKLNRPARAWVLGSAAGIALILGGGMAAQAATADHSRPPKPVPSTPDTPVPTPANPKPVPSTPAKPKPVPSTPDTPAPAPVPGDAEGRPLPAPAEPGPAQAGR
ncbi:hypothetical protein [Streptomyces sp. NPDC021212]|uniref:hypothetical protein n=1 Tax=Streptomyces sp. NPDC021212 TaxID=3365118 RepID=UPI00379C2641